MATERTFLAIKPDGVQRGLVGEIIGRFERKGFKLVGLKQLTPSRELAESHYGVHRERPFFAGLVAFITRSTGWSTDQPAPRNRSQHPRGVTNGRGGLLQASTP